MKLKMFTLIAALLTATTVQAASITDDNLDLGKQSSSGSKSITFKGPTTKTLGSTSGGVLSYSGDTLSIGGGTNIDKLLQFNIGGSNPFWKYDSATGEMQSGNATAISHGANTLKVGDGTNSNKTIRFNKGASSPEIRYNSTTAKLEFTNDASTYKAIGSGSGGGGGINLITNNADFEAGVITDYVSSTATVTSQSYASPTGDNTKFARIVSTSGYYETNTFLIPTFLQNADCEVNFNYNQSTSGNFRVDVFTSGTVVASSTIVSSTTWVQGPKIFYPCGTTDTKVRFQATASGTLDIDDVYIGSLRSLKNGAIITANTKFTAVISGGGTIASQNLFWYQRGDMIVLNGDFVIGTPQASALTITLPNSMRLDTNKISLTARANMFGSVKILRASEANILTTGPNDVDLVAVYSGTDTQIQFAKNIPSAANPIFANNAATDFANAGSRITLTEVAIPIMGLSGSSTTFDAKCPNDISCTNEFGIAVSSADVASGENLDWVNGDCTNATTGRGTCNFNAGLFAATPNCQISSVLSGSEAYIISLSSSSIVYETRTSGGTTTDSAVILTCSRSTDSVSKRTIEGYLSKSVIHGAITPPRIVSGEFYTTTPGTVCTASPCDKGSSLVTDPAVSSISRTGVGDYTINFLAGTFSAKPKCYFMVVAASSLQANSTNNAFQSTNTSTAYRFNTVNAQNNGTQNVSGEFTCIGPM